MSWTRCPGCGSRIEWGADVVGVDHDDPSQCLWHTACLRTPQDLKCRLKPYADMADWYSLHRAEHDGLEWEERIQTTQGPVMMHCLSSSLHKHSSVEGVAAEWREIAWAIENRQSEAFTRCAAVLSGDGYLVYSPRNTMPEDRTLLTLEAALEMAQSIRTVVG